MKLLALPLLFTNLLLLLACSKQMSQRSEMTRLSDIPQDSLQALSGQKIFFGHQSVGNGILNGVGMLSSEKNLTYEIFEMDNNADPRRPVIAHVALGKNMYPEKKIDAFYNHITSGVGDWADIAFFKFCFVDVIKTTNVDSLFSSYRQAIENLRKEFPNVVFVHVTVPLVSRRQGWKDTVKGLLGRKMGSDDDNVKRNEYNELLLKEYEGIEPIFDLALAESTRQDGTREFFSYNDNVYFTLAGEYASDGAHLNELGQRHVAEQFIVALSRAAKKN